MRNENGPGLVDLLFYDYDTAGRLARVTARPMGGGDRIAEAYEYDSAGRKKKTLYVDLAAQRPNTQYAWGVEGTDSSYSAPGAATLTTLYNGHEQPTDLLFYDEAGRLLSRVEFRYDRDGNLVDHLLTVEPAAVLGKLGGQATAKRGSAYFRKIAAMRKTRAGGRPSKPQ